MAIYDLRIERHVIGGLIKNPACFPDAERWVNGKDFYHDVHCTIFSVMREILISGQKIDKILLGSKIKEMGISFKDDINIYDYIESLAFTQITSKATIDACKELLKLRIRRNIYETAKDVANYVKTNGDKDVDKIITDCDSIYNDQIRSYEVNADEPDNLFGDMEELVEKRGNSPEEEFGLITPYAEFNRLYGGLRPGNIYAIASRPGQGKTTWLNDIGLKSGELNNVPVLVCDTEMSKEEVQFRMAAALSGVPVWYLESGNWRKNPEMVEKVRAIWSRIKDKTYNHIHVGNKSTDQVCSLARRWYFKHVGRGNRCIIIYDYMKLTNEKMSNNWAEHQALGEKIDKFKKLSEELNAAFLTAIQMNRSGENFNRDSSKVVYDSSAIAQSDRLQWYASFVAIFCRKTLDEMAADGEEFGTHKLVPLKTRFQGKDAAGHHDIVQRRFPDGSTRWVNNHLNFNVDNFVVEERGSLIDIVRRENEQFPLDDGGADDSALL
jgi:replicative DNA helicase